MQDYAAAPYVRLLALLVRRNGALMADYLNDFKVTLEVCAPALLPGLTRCPLHQLRCWSSALDQLVAALHTRGCSQRTSHLYTIHPRHPQNLVFLPPNAALSLLLALWPMCRERQDIQAYMITLLRQAMFRWVRPPPPWMQAARGNAPLPGSAPFPARCSAKFV